MDNIDVYFQGKRLYGDDFDENQLEEWYADEKEGYADLGAKDNENYTYGYHALNERYAYRYLKGRKFNHVLGFGSAYGHELLPLISQIKKITIVDPSDSFEQTTLEGVPVDYIKPTITGKLPAGDEEFDLITCLGVLHHIPNVSFVVRELARTLKPGGTFILREPIVSMGDWRQPRAGLTRRERGIPLSILLSIVKDAGLVVRRQSLCVFPLTKKIWKAQTFSTPAGVATDAFMCAIFRWNLSYHARTSWQRLRPTSVFMVISK